MARLTVTADKQAMSEAAAERITSILESAIVTRGTASIALTGGSTPDVLYQLLGDPGRSWRTRIDWIRLHVFWGDEREVPPDHPQSNYGLAHRLLLSDVPVPEAQIHRMRGELPATDAGDLYDAVLRLRRDQTTGPMFDVQLLGIGENVHIASLFPDSPLLARPDVTARLAAGIQIPELNTWRITMTPAALLDSAHIIMIAATSSKAEAVSRAIEGEEDLARYPAQLLRRAGDRVEWIIDRDAAARLHAAPRA